ncbi:MAG: metal-dependent hydrolase [Actinomycetota bacterium]
MPAASAAGRATTIRPRRLDMDDAFDDLPRHFMGGDLVMSHVIAVLSSMFPDGEDFFVRSVRQFNDERLGDEELARRVRGFIGQEAIHGREHRAFDARLAELGYPTRTIERTIDRLLRFSERIRPPKANLAVTAALEHYTATLAELLMERQDARDQFGHPQVRNLFLWHALEESEHKAVAFDVYQKVCGIHLVRTITMNLVSVLFVLQVVGWTTWSLAHDRATYSPRLFRSLARLRHSPFLTRDAFGRLRDYNRRDFHPDDHDAAELTEHWRQQLFGEDGDLRSRLAA